MAQDIVIGGRLHSAATGNTVAGANEILDDAKGKKQNVINQEVDNEIGSDSAAGTIKGRIKNLETAVGSGGSVDERISEAAATVKSEVTGDAASDYNTLGKVEDKIQAETSRAEAAEGALDAAKANKAITLEGYGITDAYTKSETYNKTEVNGLVDTPHQNYVTVLTYAALIAIDPGSTDTIYRVSNYDGSVPQVDVTKYSEYAWDGTQYVFLCVKSQIDEVFDISVYNNNATYADLAAALGTDGANVPQTLRRGGMSVKFVHSVDNKYVQYRLMSDSWSTNTEDWSFCGNDVYVDNPEFIETHTDAKDKILYGVKADGDFYFGAGIPSQITKKTNEIESNIGNIEINVEHKVDKEEGKSLINEEFANGISYQELSALSILTDTNNRIISRVLNNGKFDFPTQKMLDIERDDSYIYKMTDNKGGTLFGVKNDLSVDWFINVPQSLAEYVKSLIDSRLTDAYQLNKTQEQNLLAAARYNTTYGKCVQMLLVSDSHGGFTGVQRAADVCKNIPSIDAIMHLGDMVGWTPNEVELDEAAATVEILKTSKRPFFVVSGNHDVGTVKDIYFTRTHEQVYTDLVKPMIDNGILSNGEYQTTGDWSERCYYYHDFKTTKIRLIVLYDYDMDLVLDDNEYWEPVAYDSSKGKIERGTTYTYDPNNPIILNCGGWKNNSFRLKKTVTTITSSINNYTSGTFPWYKLRSFSYHSKKQMDWLTNVLNTTPDGYGIVIATHQSPVFPATISDNDFSIGSNPQNTYHPNSGVPGDTVMQTALIMKIVNAWKNKTSITERIVVKDAPTTTTLQTSDYLNALEDGSGRYAYIFNADFSNRQNNNAYFINFIAGHEHCDIIEESVDYSDLFCLVTTTSNPLYRYMSDMPYTENQDSPVYDCLSILTWAKNRNIACKWGCTKTIAGIDRNYVKL